MKKKDGAILMITLIITSIFTLFIGGMVGFSLLQMKRGEQLVSWEKSIQIAESGANYYRWHLAHDPDDYTDGTGLPGPYVHTVNDPQGGTIGQFELEITAPTTCDSTVTIKSTGYTNEKPNVKRVVSATYAKPSLAQFGFLTNSNVWFGDDEELHGPVHSNGGIRQDGENDGIMTSAKDTYICGTEHGCSGESKPGIWGDGEKQELWDFPKPVVDFNAITADLADLKSQAQSSGIYLPPTGFGYHIILKDNNTFDLYNITQLQPDVLGYDGTSSFWESNDIKTETFSGNYVLPSGCPIVFVEDNVWIEGEINNVKLTVVSAVLPDIPSTNTKIIINGDITYKERNDTTSLALIAQKDILVPLYAAPDSLEINGVLLAQKGHVLRYYYTSSYNPYHIRNYIELYGAIITNTIWTWTWVNGSGSVISGYESTETIYDPTLKYKPPPGFPTDNEYDFIQWEETSDK